MAAENWFAMSERFLKDPKIVDLGENFGPSGPVVALDLMCEARQQERAGRVEVTYRTLAADTFVRREDLRPIIEHAAAVDFLSIESISELAAVIQIKEWKRWQARFRKAISRQNGSAEPAEPENVTRSHAKSRKVTDKTGQDKKKTTTSADKPPTSAEQVFNAWVASTGKNPNQVKFTDDRRRLVNARLKDWPIEDLIDAVRGWKHSAHHRGENQQRKVYNDISLLLRNAKQIEDFRDLERAAKRSGGLPEGFVP